MTGLVGVYPKHTPDQLGVRSNAGVEPKNSSDLFESSYQSGKKRYAIDETGNINQFTSNFEGTRWHWAGRTGSDQPEAKRTLPADVPNEVYKHFGTSQKKVQKL